MVRLRLALRVAAEVLLALIAPDSILAHTHRSVSGNGFAHVIFLVHVDLTFYHLHHISATASHIGVVLLNEMILL
jgi:hypothetical protein